MLWPRNPEIIAWYTTVVRFLFPILALLILIRTIRSLLTVPHVPEVWAYLTMPNGASEPPDPLGEYPGPGRRVRRGVGYPTVSASTPPFIRAEDDT